MPKRVVVTGMGCVTPFGNGWQKLWVNLIAGNSAISEISSFDTSNFRTKIAAEIKNFDIEPLISKQIYRKFDRFSQFAAAAAKLALIDAGIEPEGSGRKRFGITLGNGFGGINTALSQFETLQSRGAKRVSPFCIPMMLSSSAASNISMLFGLNGASETVSTACASSSDAIGLALEKIRSGKADLMLCGGSEAAINPLIVAGFSSMRALSEKNETPQEACKPFDKERDGFVIGEGAAMLILESIESATARKAGIYAELAGYGAANDAFHLTQPEPYGLGLVLALKAALADARCKPEDVGCINAHGTGTVANDRVEAAAIRNVFGDFADKIPVTANKPVTGHLLGAAGALEAIASVATLIKGEIPPVINLKNQDPECRLNLVANTSKKAEIETVVSESSGFGGHNSVLIFKKFKG